MVLRSFLYAIPFLYGGLFIVLPIYTIQTNYLATTVILFWFPALVLYVGLSGWMKKRSYFLKAFWVVTLGMIPLTTVFEYLALGLDIWNFTEQVDRLCGVSLFGAPLEEFSFWYGATPFCVLFYLYFRRVRESRVGKETPRELKAPPASVPYPPRRGLARRRYVRRNRIHRSPRFGFRRVHV